MGGNVYNPVGPKCFFFAPVSLFFLLNPAYLWRASVDLIGGQHSCTTKGVSGSRHTCTPSTRVLSSYLCEMPHVVSPQYVLRVRGIAPIPYGISLYDLAQDEVQRVQIPA